jgi:hypothetical protein
MLKLDDPTELRRNRRQIAIASRNRNRKGVAKFVASLTFVAVGSITATCIVRFALAIPEPFGPQVALASFIGSYAGGIGAFAGYYCSAYSQNAKPLRLAQGNWTESLAPGFVAYSFGISCSTLLAAVIASEMEFSSPTFAASAIGSVALFFTYCYFARPLVPQKSSSSMGADIAPRIFASFNCSIIKG